MRESAAAPKSTRLLWWPVRPKGIRSITTPVWRVRDRSRSDEGMGMVDETIDDGDLDDFEGIEGTLLHDRGYRVRVYAESPSRMRLRGVIRDRKPPGTMIAGD